jgi:putative ABC transport system permease protein
MRAHLQQRLDTIAIMKSLGARSSQIIKIYLLQTLFLGIVGGLIGVAGGIAVQLAFPFVLGKLINVPPEFHFQFGAVLTGLGAGVLITLLFTLPPLLDIRGVRPILILRRAVEDSESDDPFIHAARKTISKNFAQILATVLIVVGIAAIAVTLSDSPIVGTVFSIGLVVILLILLGASAALLATLKFFLNRTRLHLPSPLRHGLANLYRPGNPSAALLAALGLGVMQIMTVYLVQKDAVKEMNISAAPNLPNVFLIDIADSEIAGVRQLLQTQPSVAAAPELLPITTARIDSVDGVAAADLKLKNFPRRALRSVNLTWNDAVPAGTRIVTGAWWQPSETKPEVAISQGMATRLGVHVGSAVTFVAQDKPIAATVAAITRSNGQHAYSRADYTLNHAALTGFPIIWYGGVHVLPNQVPQFERALNHSYPTITIINVAEVVESVRSVVIQIVYVVQFLAAFSIFAGIIILASSIAGTKYRRIREVVVLKTLGATRARIATIFSIEFAVLGLVSGAIGILFANLIAWALETRTPMNLTFKPEITLNLAAIAVAAALTVITGWIASHRILGQKPLEVLREE